MIDPTDLLDLPRSFLLGILRALWWLAWDFGVETVGWSVGWIVWRAVTLGRFPPQSFNAQEQAGAGVAALVEMTGLIVLAALIWRLSGAWPD